MKRKKEEPKTVQKIPDISIIDLEDPNMDLADSEEQNHSKNFHKMPTKTSLYKEDVTDNDVSLEEPSDEIFYEDTSFENNLSEEEFHGDNHSQGNSSEDNLLEDDLSIEEFYEENLSTDTIHENIYHESTSKKKHSSKKVRKPKATMKEIQDFQSVPGNEINISEQNSDLDDLIIEDLFEEHNFSEHKCLPEEYTKSGLLSKGNEDAISHDNLEDNEDPIRYNNENFMSEDHNEELWANETWANEPEFDQEDASPRPLRRFFHKINWHIVFLVFVVICVGLVVYRVKTFGKFVDLSKIEGVDDNDVLDSILPLIIPKDQEINIVDDGVTTILAFGNAPFADDRDSEDNLARLIEKESEAVVYNCSVQGSYLAAKEETLLTEEEPMDAFNFYWLTVLMCLNDESVRNNYNRAFASFGDNIPEGAKEAYNTLTSLDMSKVDVVTLMYDGSDYLDNRDMYDDVNVTNIQTFTGNMEAGIELIQKTYPHIRIIVMSPTYVFAIDEEGEYVPSDLYRYDHDVFSTYVIKQFGSAYTRSVTFVDNLYGTITADNAQDYLLDNLHLNLEGRKLVAQRFVYALELRDRQGKATSSTANSK